MHLRFLLIFNGKFGGVGRLIIRQICSLRSYRIREISNKLCLTIRKDIEQSVLFQFRACYSKCGPRVSVFPGSLLEVGFWSLAQHIMLRIYSLTRSSVVHSYIIVFWKGWLKPWFPNMTVHWNHLGSFKKTD